MHLGPIVLLSHVPKVSQIVNAYMYVAGISRMFADCALLHIHI